MAPSNHRQPCQRSRRHGDHGGLGLRTRAAAILGRRCHPPFRLALSESVLARITCFPGRRPATKPGPRCRRGSARARSYLAWFPEAGARPMAASSDFCRVSAGFSAACTSLLFQSIFRAPSRLSRAMRERHICGRIKSRSGRFSPAMRVAGHRQAKRRTISVSPVHCEQPSRRWKEMPTTPERRGISARKLGAACLSRRPSSGGPSGLPAGTKVTAADDGFSLTAGNFPLFH